MKKKKKQHVQQAGDKELHPELRVETSVGLGQNEASFSPPTNPLIYPPSSSPQLLPLHAAPSLHSLLHLLAADLVGVCVCVSPTYIPGEQCVTQLEARGRGVKGAD